MQFERNLPACEFAIHQRVRRCKPSREAIDLLNYHNMVTMAFYIGNGLTISRQIWRQKRNLRGRDRGRKRKNLGGLVLLSEDKSHHNGKSMLLGAVGRSFVIWKLT